MVLFKLLLFLIILYYAYRASRNLVRAVLSDPKASTRLNVPEPPAWTGPPARRDRGADVEDARWVDLS